MHDILGDDLFFGGLRYYLKDHEFSVANEQDLWSSVQRVRVEEIMSLTKFLKFCSMKLATNSYFPRPTVIGACT